jgi:hypothetical protein
MPYDAPMFCIGTKADGNPCTVKGEDARRGYCHLHDPNGIYQLNLVRSTKKYKKAKARCTHICDEDCGGLA